MILTSMFIILFILCVAGLLLYPKTERGINGCKAIIMGIMAIFCYQALMAFIYNKIGIRVSLKSTAVSMVIADVLLWFQIFRKKKIQKVFWRLSDVLSLVLLAAFVLAISYHLFSYWMRLSYANSDPANHFKFAMTVLKTGKVESIYFSAFIDAMFIELLSPFLALAKYYKAFIVADIFMHIMEICMFYVLLLTISDKKIVRILAPFLSICYFFGYPAYSYMTGGFVYWSNGVMILILIIYALLLLERYPDLRKSSAILLFLAAYANSCCNKLFIPVNYFALFAALAVLIIKNRKHAINKKLFWGIVAGIIAAASIVVIVFWNSWGGSLKNMIEYVSVPGGIYRSMYADLIFFVPAMILVFYFVFIKREYSKTISLMSICMILCTVGMYIFWYHYLMSTYYYYKIYYNLWLFGWLLAIMALDIMADKKQLIGFFSYGGMVVAIGVLTLTNYDFHMWHHNVDYNGSYATKQLFSLYRYNMDSLLTDYEKEYSISSQVLDVFGYSTENYWDEFVPIASSDVNLTYWYDGMKAQDSKEFHGDVYELMDIVRRLDEYGITKIAVYKEDSFYAAYQAYFENCVPVYENEEAAILTYSGNSWADVHAVIPDYSQEKQELFTYVADSLADQDVPLLAEQSSFYDFIEYQNITGKTYPDFYSWKYNPKENLDNLNEHGVQYIVLLQEDGFYQNNAAYFDTQETVFENAAGKIVKCNGNKWSTEYK